MEDNVRTLDKKATERLMDFLSPYKNRLIAILIMSLPFGFIEALFPYMSKYAIDNFVVKKTIDGLGTYTAIFLFAVLIIVLLFSVYIRILGRLECDIRYKIRDQGFDKLQDLSFSYYDKTAVGWIMSRMVSDAYNISEIICWGLFDIGYAISTLVGYLVFMFSLDVKLSLISFIVLPIILVMSFFFHKNMLTIQRKVKAVNSKITAAYNEDIQGAKTTKTLVREELNLEEFNELTLEYRNISLKSSRLSAIFLPSIIALGSIGTALVLTLGGHSVIAGALSLGTLSAFISYTLNLYEPIRQLGAIFSELLSAQASAERVLRLLYEEPDVKDNDEVLAKYKNSDSGLVTIPEIIGNIEFRNVDFYYNEKEPILKDFNLKVNAGETIALVGETGSGKSTIVNLLCRFYEPVSGEVFIDGINYKDLPQSWIHSNLGYVLQTPHLFSGTIQDNVRYGKLDATDEEIIEACKLVNADEFIMQTEKGYETEVGEGGSLLSTGQKQLISFARAIVRRPALFVLDEATSSVDTETEKKLQTAINSMLKGRTSFVVAHRLSTIRNADKILVINRGRIVEAGNHKDLINKKGEYYRLYINQFIEERSRDLESKPEEDKEFN